MHTNRTRVTALAIAIALSLSLIACKDQKLRDLVVASDKIADTVAIVQKSAVDAELAGTLNREQTRAVMQLTIQISQANNSAMSIARNLSKLDEPSRAQLLTILKPIIDVANKAVTDPNILGIQNAQTREAIRGGFVAIQTSLSSINLMLASSN